MFIETTLILPIYLNLKPEQHCTFENEISFTLVPDQNELSRLVKIDYRRPIECGEPENLTFHIKNISGDIQFLKIMHSYGKKIDVTDTHDKKCFKFPFVLLFPRDTRVETSVAIEMHISTKIHFKKVNYVDVPYRLQINATRMKHMKRYEYMEHIIILPGYYNMSLKCFIKRIDDCSVEVHIKNPHKIYINEKATDYKCIRDVKKDINLSLNFVFDTDIINTVLTKP